MSSLGEVLYISQLEVERLGIGMREIIRVVEEAFREKAEGRVEVPPRPGIHPQRDALHACMLKYLQWTRMKRVKREGCNINYIFPVLKKIKDKYGFRRKSERTYCGCVWVIYSKSHEGVIGGG